MVYTPQTNWEYDDNLYHSIQSGPQRTGDDLNLTDTYLTSSSGYTTPSGISQTWEGVILEGADFGKISSGPPNAIDNTQIVETHIVKVQSTYFENWAASGLLSGCANSGYDNLPSGCYSGTADPSCAITYPVGPSGELPSGCQVIYASGILSSGTRTEFLIDEKPVLNLQLKKGAIYIFDQSDSSNISNGLLFSKVSDGYHTVTNSGYWVSSGVLSGCSNSGYDNLPSGCYSGTDNTSCTITYPVGPSGELPSGCVVAYPSGFVDVLSSGVTYTDGVTVSGTPGGGVGSAVYFTVPYTAPSTLYYFGATTSGIGSFFRVVAPLEPRPWSYSTAWRAVPPAISGYWTNYENVQPHSSGLLDSYIGFRAQGLYKTANATVQTAFGPEPGLRNFGTHTWYGEQIPDNQIYSPFRTPGSNDNTLDGGGITGGGVTHPTHRSPTLTNPTNDTSGSRAAWVYHYPIYCQSFTETRYSSAPGQMGQPSRNSYRGKSLRYVPNYGSIYGVLGEGVRNMVRKFSP